MNNKRVLVINNLYPPVVLGGYEQLCYDIANELQQRDFAVTVLTTGIKNYSSKYNENGINVVRKLIVINDYFQKSRPGNIERYLKHLYNSYWINRTIAQINPDIIFLWNMENITYTFSLEHLFADKRTFMHISAPYIIDELKEMKNLIETQPQIVKYTADILGIRKNIFEKRKISRASCSCRYLKKQLIAEGVGSEELRIVDEAIPLAEIKKASKPRDFNKPGLKVLYAGQFLKDKGIETYIEAVKLLNRNGSGYNLEFAIIGTGKQEYVARIREIMANNETDKVIKVMVPVPRERLIEIFQEYDILVFPSSWPEMGSLILKMAVASGMGIISTMTGGTPELISDGRNCISFPANDAQILSEKIILLKTNRDLLKKISAEAKKTVGETHSSKGMVDSFEKIWHSMGLIKYF